MNKSNLGLLVAAWGCGLFWGIGLFMTMLVLVAQIVIAAVTFGSSASMASLEWLLLGLGLVIVIASPALMGYFLARSRRGLTSGLIALPVGAIVLFACYWVADLLLNMIGFLYEIVSSQPPGIFFSALTGASAVAVVATVILMDREMFPLNLPGLGIGLTIGLGLSFVSGLALSQSVLTSDIAFLHFFWQIPPLVWVSAVYFPELMAGRSGWKGFIVWALLILATFGLPFIIVPVLERAFG